MESVSKRKFKLLWAVEAGRKVRKRIVVGLETNIVRLISPGDAIIHHTFRVPPRTLTALSLLASSSIHLPSAFKLQRPHLISSASRTRTPRSPPSSLRPTAPPGQQSPGPYLSPPLYSNTKPSNPLSTAPLIVSKYFGIPPA